MESLRICTENFERSVWPAVAWRFSNLCSDGSPLQFAFSSCDDKLRFATEVAGPEVPERERPSAACRLAARLGADVPVEKLRAWETLQEGHALRWGTWLGVTHDGAAARLKVYVEVPRALRAAEAAPIGPAIVRSSRLMMIGYDCAGRSHEHYYRQPTMDRAESETFMRFIEGSPGRRAAVAAFRELCDLPLRVALDWVNFGYSIDGGGAFSLFARARSLPNRERIPAAFLGYEFERGRRESAFRDFFRGAARERLPDFGVISFIGRGFGDAEMRTEASATSIAAIMAPATV